VEPGDLVKILRFNRMGIVIEIFDDLDKANPWVRVLFTTPEETYQWCKKEGLILVSKKKGA